MRSNSAIDACSSTAVVSIWPIGNSSRVCRPVKATTVPLLRFALPATR